jgi:hypothetical protein
LIGAIIDDEQDELVDACIDFQLNFPPVLRTTANAVPGTKIP